MKSKKNAQLYSEVKFYDELFRAYRVRYRKIGLYKNGKFLPESTSSSNKSNGARK